MYKKINLSVIASLIAFIALQAQSNLTFQPEKPRPGETIQINYRASSKVFTSNDVIECTVKKWGDYADQEALIIGQTYKKQIVALKKNGNVYQATIATDDKTRALTLDFTSGKLKVERTGTNMVLKEGKFDSNDSLGYVIPFYDNQGAVLRNTNLSLGQYFLWDNLRSKGFSNPKLARSYILKEIESFPSEANSLATIFLTYTYDEKDRKEFEDVAKRLINTTLQKDSLKEDDYSLISDLAYNIKLKGISKYFSKEANEKFKDKPGIKSYNAFINQFSNETDIAKKYGMIQLLTDRFNQLSLEQKFNFAYSDAIPLGCILNFEQYLFLKGTPQQITQYGKKLNIDKNIGLFLPFSLQQRYSTLVDSLKNYDLGVKTMLADLDYHTHQYEAISKGKAPSFGVWDDYLTTSDKLKSINDGLITINTYLAVAYKGLNNDAKAFEYIGKARNLMTSLEEEPGNAADINEKYIAYAEGQLPNEKLKPEVEKIILSGKWTQSTLDVLKRIYVKEKGSDAGFDTYLSDLKKSKSEELKKSLKDTQLNEPAPAFSLTDLSGKTVNLSDYKGKTVILDFWATWCGPCKASFPAMKKLQESFGGKQDVKILFIDTFEQFKTVADNTKAVSDFLTSKNYPFHVLLDSKNKAATDYKVTGIPAKIIIDGNGNIRYKIVGAEVVEGKLIDEMNAMIESVK
jgi:thiol-disulfide isomerase/thioredoxin